MRNRICLLAHPVVALAYRYSSRTDLSRRLVPLAELAGQAVSPAARQPQAQPRRLHFRLTEDVRQALVEDYLNGIPTTELTSKYSLGKGSVLQILEDAGVSMRRQGLGEAEIDEAVRLYQSGLSLVRVAKSLDSAPTTVNRALQARGVRLRPRR